MHGLPGSFRLLRNEAYWRDLLPQREKIMMNSAINLKTISVLLLPCASIGCERDAEDRMEDQAERVEERAEARAEARENVGEKRQIDSARHELGTNEPSTKAATVQGLTPVTVTQIADARCEREQKCGNIGADKDYTSKQLCTQKISEEWRDELNTYECPGGVVTKELSECLDEIKNEDCSSPFDTLGRVVACRSSDICKALG
jgi:hypothetical protein